ncbi:MAG: hypothetical protein QM796_16710 [Chthoniobacteraceae bacterium]
MFEQFGIDIGKALLQTAIYFIPAIWATIRVVRLRSGASVPCWLLFVWIIPLIGPLIALLTVRKREQLHAA